MTSRATTILAAGWLAAGLSGCFYQGDYDTMLFACTQDADCAGGFECRRATDGGAYCCDQEDRGCPSRLIASAGSDSNGGGGDSGGGGTSPCNCVGRQACHHESGLCFDIVDAATASGDSCHDVFAPSDLGTYSFDTRLLLADDEQAACGGAGGKDLSVSWSFQETNVFFRVRATTSAFQPVLSTRIPPYAASQCGGGVSDCVADTTGPTYVVDSSMATDTLGGRANFIIDSLDGRAGVVTITITRCGATGC